MCARTRSRGTTCSRMRQSCRGRTVLRAELRGRVRPLSGAWRWLPKREAPHAIPEGASAATELAVLRGEEVTHVRRWSAHDWVWSDPTLLRNWEDVRTVPLISLLASDPTLMCALSLRVGEGLQRLSQSHDWVVNASEVNRTSYRVMLRTDEFTTFEGYSESLRALGCNCQSVRKPSARVDRSARGEQDRDPGHPAGRGACWRLEVFNKRRRFTIGF